MKKIEKDSFLQFEFVGNPIFSPTGAYAAFVVQSPDIEENNYRGDIYLYSFEDKKTKRMTGDKNVSSFCWQKDSSLLFPSLRNPKVKKRREEGENITSFYELSLTGGEAEEAFTIPLFVYSIEDIGEGKYILTALEDESYPNLDKLSCEERKEALEKYKAPPYRQISEVPFWSNLGGFVSKKRTALYIYERNSGSLKRLTDEKFDVTFYKYKSGKILVGGGKYESVRFRHQGLYIYDTEGNSRCILEPDTYKNEEADFLNDNKLILALSKGGRFTHQEYCDFYTYDLKLGSLEKIADYDYSIGYCTIGSDSALISGQGFKIQNNRAYFITTVDEKSLIRSVGEKGDIKDEYNYGACVKGFDIREDKMVIAAMEPYSLTEIYDQSKNKLTFFNDNFFKEREISIPEKFRFTASDGYEIRGWAMKPIDFDKDRKYPAVLNIHGGPRTAFGEAYYNEMQLWAAKGFFVIYCNPRGSDARDADFGYITGKYGTVEYENLMEFTDEALRRYPQIDKDRLGVAGGSYGGFMTNWIIGHTQRFSAAVSQRSISDWVSFQFMSDIGYFFSEEQIGASAFDDIKKVWESSPLKYADKVKTPTLFIHSDSDYRCHMAEAISMFTALKMFGVPSRMCLFKGENHELSRSGRPRNRIKRMEEILNWLTEYLHNREA